MVRQERQRDGQCPRDTHCRQPDRRQHVAARHRIVVGRKAKIAEDTAETERSTIAAHPHCFLAFPNPVQHDRGTGDCEERHQFESDGQRGCARQPHRKAATPHIRISQPGNRDHQHRKLPAMMIDAQWHEHQHRRLTGKHQPGGKRERSRGNKAANGHAHCKHRHQKRD